jgi:8-oxoguanine deaminase
MALRIEHATVVAWREERPAVLRDCTIMIENGMIREMGPSSPPLNKGGPGGVGGGTNAPQSQTRPIPLDHGETPIPDDVIDASRHLVIPGLINTHHHLYQSLTRGLKSVQDAPLFEWLTQLYQRWRHLTYDAVRDAASVSLAELMLSGCTTSSDHFYIFPQGTDVRIEAVLEAAEQLGIRIHACRGSMSVGRSRGGLPPDDCVQSEHDILDDTLRVVERFNDASPLSMRRIDLAPCSPFSVSGELLRDTAALARERKLLLHTHAAETLDEERYCIEKFGVRPIRFLQDAGWLGSDVYLAHCVHLSDDEITLLAETETGIAHCPCSNMRLGSGIPPIRRLLERGARVGLGVDGSSSNDGGHLLAEARQALLLQRVAGGAEAMRLAEAFRLPTLGGADVLNRPILGNLDVGRAADLAMFRADDVAFAGAIAQDPLAALVLCHTPRVDRLIVGGRTVVKDGQIVGTDLLALVERFNKLVTDRFRD